MTEVELENLVVKLVGDNSDLIKSLEETVKAVEVSAKEIDKAVENVSATDPLKEMVEQFAKVKQELNELADAAGSADVALKNIEAPESLTGIDVAAGVLAASVIERLAGKFEQLGRSAVRSFSEQEDADTALRSALESNSRAVDDTFKRYQKFASEIQRTTRMADENVVSLLTQAESFELTGEAAERAAKSAIGLAALPGSKGSAAMMLRVSAAMEKNNVKQAMMFSKFIPQLRGIRDEMEFQTKYHKLVVDGFKAEEALAKTFSGTMARMGNSVSDLMEDFGEIVAEQIKPFVEWVVEGARALKMLPPETKKIIVTMGAWLVGAVALVASLSVLKLIIGFLAIGFSMLLSPMAMVVAGVYMVGKAIVSWFTQGGEVADWFGKKFARLMDYLRPTIDAMMSAFKAGEFGLAADIAMAQIKLSFLEGTKALKELWGVFVGYIKLVWATAVADIKSMWLDATTFIAEQMIKTQGSFSKFWLQWRVAAKIAMGATKEEIEEFVKSMKKAVDVEEVLKTLKEDADRQRSKIDEDAAKALADVNTGYAESLKEVTDAIKKAEEDLKALREKAKKAEEAVKNVKAPPLKIPPIPTQTVKVIAKWDAAEFGSADALGRIQELADRFTGHVEKNMGEAAGKALKKVDVSTAGAAAGPAAAAAHMKENLDAWKKLIDQLTGSGGAAGAAGAAGAGVGKAKEVAAATGAAAREGRAEEAAGRAAAGAAGAGGARRTLDFPKSTGRTGVFQAGPPVYRGLPDVIHLPSSGGPLSSKQQYRKDFQEAIDWGTRFRKDLSDGARSAKDAAESMEWDKRFKERVQPLRPLSTEESFFDDKNPVPIEGTSKTDEELSRISKGIDRLVALAEMEKKNSKLELEPADLGVFARMSMGGYA